MCISYIYVICYIHPYGSTWLYLYLFVCCICCLFVCFCLSFSSLDLYSDFLHPLMRHFGYSGFLSLKSKTPRVIEGCALFVRDSRFKILKKETFSISEEILVRQTNTNGHENTYV